MIFTRQCTLSDILMCCISLFWVMITVSGCMLFSAHRKAPGPFSHCEHEPYALQFINFYKNAVEGYFRPSLLDIDLWQKRLSFHNGWVCYKKKEWSEAIHWFQAALNEYPYLKDYTLFFIATCMENKGEFKGAASLLSEIIHTWPESPLIPETNLKLADMYFCQEEYQKAIEAYERALTILPEKEAYIRYQIGVVSLDKDQNRALKNFKALIAQSPNSDFSRLAQRHIDALVQKDMSPPGLHTPFFEQTFNRAEKLFLKRKYDEAIKAYQSVITAGLDPQNWCQAMYHLAKCYKKKGKPDLAMKSLEAIIQTQSGGECLSEARVMFAWMLWNNHRNKEALWHLEYLVEDKPFGNKTDEALYYMGRIAEDEGRFLKAVEYYTKITDGFLKGPFYQVALWRTGWIYYRQGEYEKAAAHFYNYGKTLEDDTLRHKYLYWQGRSEEKMGKRRSARYTYKMILDEPYWSFYSGLCEIRLGRYRNHFEHTYFNALKKETEPLDAFFILSEKEKAILNPIWELWLLGLKDEAIRQIRYHAYKGKKSPTPQLLYALSLLAHTSGAYDLGIQIGILYKNKLGGYLTDIPAYKTGNILLYPPGFLPEVLECSRENHLDPILVLSLIRQESLFDPIALSSASAYGLMQVIPSTGRSSAKALTIDLPQDMTCLFDTDLNLTLGCFYLAQVIEGFEQNIVYALAAYNAGPGAVRKWQKRFAGLDMDEFIESIPYGETRDYVKRVMRNYWVYRKLSTIGQVRFKNKPN